MSAPTFFNEPLPLIGADTFDRRPDFGVRVRVEDGSLPGVVQTLLAADVDRKQCAYSFEWYTSDDDLVHFVYGNQGPLFMEDARPYRNSDGSISIACDGERDMHDVILGTWESRAEYYALMTPPTPPSVTQEMIDAATLAKQLASEISNLASEAAKELAG